MTGEVPDAEIQKEYELTNRLEYWQWVLADSSAEDSPEVVDIAIAELDNLWEQQGLMGVECIVNGKGFWTSITERPVTEDDDAKTMDASAPRYTLTPNSGDIVDKSGFSKGYFFRAMTENDSPQLWCGFLNGHFEDWPNPTTLQITESYIFADINCSVIPRDDFEAPFLHLASQGHGDENGSDLELLAQYSDTFVGLVNSPRFRNTKRKKQLALIDERIQVAETDVMILGRGVIATPDFAYTSEPRDDGSIDYKLIDLRKVCVSGTCLAITMLGRERLAKKAIRKGRDLVGKYDGLYLTIALDGDVITPSSELSLSPSSVLHVPISRQDF